MQKKSMIFSNFSQAIKTRSDCFRPETGGQLSFVANLGQELLVRGNGQSYSDCALNDGGIIIDSSRLNRLLSFDETSQIVSCEPAATFACLFLIHPEFIPPVIPGTLRATIAGGIANDIHGKNNPEAGTLGQHIAWIELQIGERLITCSQETEQELFQATIGGLGLTGIMKRIGLTLKKQSHFVNVATQKYETWQPLLDAMQQNATHCHYQAAWLDLMHPAQGILFSAHPCDGKGAGRQHRFSIPPLPFSLIKKWSVACFNRYYFHATPEGTSIQSLPYFNNPLDALSHWQRLYGRKGFLQFQAVFDAELALSFMQDCLKIIKNTGAVPTLAVLKFFKEPGFGLLSFVQPGFTLAIDFANTPEAKAAILALNALITEIRGKVYLAKDLLLTKEQFQSQYQQYPLFMECLQRYPSQLQSSLSRRLGLTL